jgi:hypothetical protein
MQNVTFDGYNLPTLARATRALECPTDGGIAWLVWRISNSDRLPAAIADEFMREAGYVPFQGYPLKLAGR